MAMLSSVLALSCPTGSVAGIVERSIRPGLASKAWLARALAKPGTTTQRTAGTALARAARKGERSELRVASDQPLGGTHAAELHSAPMPVA